MVTFIMSGWGCVSESEMSLLRISRHFWSMSADGLADRRASGVSNPELAAEWGVGHLKKRRQS